MTEEPDISYLVAAYNAAPWIESAIQSALDQSDVRVEIIVADDASTDQTLAIVQQMAEKDARVVLIRRPISGGPAAARNSALTEARGKWIGILDADDLLEPNRSRLLIDAAKHSGSVIIADNLFCFTENNPDHGHCLLDEQEPFFVNVAIYLRRNLVMGGPTNLGYLKPIVRRSLIIEHKLLYDERLRIGEDFNFCLRCMAVAPLLIWPEPLYRYRLRSGSISRGLAPTDLEALIAAHVGVFNQPLTPLEYKANRAFLRALRDLLTYVRFTHLLRRKAFMQSFISATNPRIWRTVFVLARRKVAERRLRSPKIKQPHFKAN